MPKTSQRKEVRYHIGKDMIPRKCNAEEGNCPLGGEHYKSKAEAQIAADDQMFKQELENSKKTSENTQEIIYESEPIDDNRKARFNSTKVVTNESARYYEVNAPWSLDNLSKPFFKGDDEFGKRFVDELNEFTETDFKRLRNAITIIDGQFVPEIERAKEYAFDEMRRWNTKKDLENCSEISADYQIEEIDDLNDKLNEFVNRREKDSPFLNYNDSNNSGSIIVTTKENVDKYINGIGEYFSPVTGKNKIKKSTHNASDDKYSATNLYNARIKNLYEDGSDEQAELGFSVTKKLTGFQYAKYKSKEKKDYDLYFTYVNYRSLVDANAPKRVVNYKVFVVPKEE